MKILEQGYCPPLPPPPFPIGKPLWCERCGTEFEVQEGDNYTATTPAPEAGRQALVTPCPTCDFPLRFDSETLSYPMGSQLKEKLAATRKRNAAKMVEHTRQQGAQ
jgi:hypothetical protein